MTPLQFITDARKFLVAIIAALAVLAAALSDNVITPTEWFQVVVAFLGALGVYSIPNGNKGV